MKKKGYFGGQGNSARFLGKILCISKRNKSYIHGARVRAVLATSREHIRLYWNIGKKIVGRQEKSGWGKAIVERLSEDLQKEYPGVQGYGLRIYGTCDSFIWNTRTSQISNDSWRNTLGPEHRDSIKDRHD